MRQKEHPDDWNDLPRASPKEQALAGTGPFSADSSSDAAREARFQALADNIAQLVWMADASGSLFWYNRRWFEYTGTSLEEMRGWGWRAVHHPDYVEGVAEKFRAHVLSGEPWEDTFPLRGTDGIYRWFLSRAFPTKDALGNVTLWCGTNTDITEQRETEAALSRAEGRVRSLYELTSRTGLPFSDKVNHLLRMGREWLGMETGVLSRIDEHAGIYEVAQIDAAGATLSIGFACALEQTFCSETVRRGPESPPLAVEHAAADDAWRNHPAHEVFGVEAYLATAIRVNDSVWGTLAFFTTVPRREPFTQFDSDMVRLMAQWIGGELARREAEDALLANAALQRRFVREMIMSVTEGKLCLCDGPQDLPAPLSPVGDEVDLSDATLRNLRKTVEAIAQDLHLPKERTQDLLTAAGEAGMNAVKHGGGGKGCVRSDPEGRKIQVWVSDHGTGIRQEDLHRATLEKGWSGAGSLGHGFFLMLRTADRTYLLTGAEGTTVVLEQASEAPPPAWLSA